jgi:FMN-dependent NADH-azoreductase
MSKLLYVIGSPRNHNSLSSTIAEAYLETYRKAHPNVEIDVLDIWSEHLPEFDGNKAAAKMSFFGVGTLEGEVKTAWDEILAVIQRFTAADEYLFTVPMWNDGIPYRLKLYIDILTQPGLTFGFDPATGYSGLLSSKKATSIYTSGVYSLGAPQAYGTDFHSSYFENWLRFVGITDREVIRFQPSLLTADPVAGLDAATARARHLAGLQLVAGR